MYLYVTSFQSGEYDLLAAHKSFKPWLFVSAISCVLVTSFQPGEWDLLAAHKPYNLWLFVSAILIYICERCFLFLVTSFQPGEYDLLAAHKPCNLSKNRSYQLVPVEVNIKSKFKSVFRIRILGFVSLLNHRIRIRIRNYLSDTSINMQNLKKLISTVLLHRRKEQDPDL